jgi:hypothetical protein
MEAAKADKQEQLRQQEHQRRTAALDRSTIKIKIKNQINIKKSAKKNFLTQQKKTCGDNRGVRVLGH